MSKKEFIIWFTSSGLVKEPPWIDICPELTPNLQPKQFKKNLLISLQNLQRNEPIVNIDWVTRLDNLGKISIIDIDFKLISIFQIIRIQRQTEFITLKILSLIICHKFTLLNEVMAWPGLFTS